MGQLNVYAAHPNQLAGNPPHLPMAERLIASIREISELLQEEADLSPANQRVTAMIRRLSLQLRSRYLPEEVHAVLSNEYVRNNQPQLHTKLAKAEFLVELDDCRRICQAGDSASHTIASLPYWEIYTALVGEELAVLRQLGAVYGEPAERKPAVAFVGSGPMPLSAILLHLLGGVHVACLEFDAAAYEASCSLLQHIGLAEQVSVIMQDGAAFDYCDYSCAFVASLVRNKLAVLEQISRTAPQCLAAVRTAEGMKQIMYEAIDEQQLAERGWRLLARTLPRENLVINSTLFLAQ